MEKIILNDDDIAEANLELAKNYIHKACATSDKEKIIKNLLVARSSLDKSLTLFGYKD